MRSFVAVELPQEAVDEIIRVQKLILKKTLFTGKLTESKNLHLTLKFLGEIDENKIEEVKKKLKEIKFKDFFAEFGEIGVFSKDFIKIIWIKLNGKEIWELQKEIDNKLTDLFNPEARFMGHITIARVKNVNDKNKLLDYLKNIKLKKLKFCIKEFALKKSELFQEGPVYSDIEEYGLSKNVNHKLSRICIHGIY